MTDRDDLVEFFRHEEAEWGAKGDYENWPPERSAIELIRHLRAALSRRAGDADPAGIPSRERHWQEAVDWIVKHLRALCEFQPDVEKRQPVLAIAAALDEGAIASMRKVYPATQTEDGA